MAKKQNFQKKKKSVAVESMGDASARSKRTFKEFSYKGVNLETLTSMSISEFKELLPSKLRRSINRGFSAAERDFIKKCIKARSENTGLERPEQINTNTRNLPILPTMIGLQIGVYSGRDFMPMVIKEEMLGRRLRDYVETRKLCTHGRPGVGATSSSKFVPLK
ncbi:Ribosomal protein S19 [Spraguea lophii 42_110]|uniref:Ribosomal protein S19 n=1 Tax=Spraguea lophii (strain 42_110) TaxID=1358809 RepID=S7XKY9_SPRLO|nr:Chain SP0, Ribosomal protein S19 [Spraguea lophii 42_110]7QJH_RP0 Chain RP0, Ribosomal protein S19 [Spraguea lophii 42_110]7QJH_SP0 Chain SP0, Ribosomal protein S19 [Spraguea lophii 42_110]8BR3_SP0 Chain SP0, Ribosomal protein S19 [Spraguea lophii 42_110]8P5D_SP0 Chain SP0, Ribosomal protein S19 [Spraguea lophii 42_110]8P60_RP0 Chain RP0, Ribosomal protein S19 [Spraguea lophii 42_110]8P60_SP0 Chain SP0, Ribosomal protein S19 [Spraguea lophii 42_110]EPR79699.1 Ribosomal protein S19 [Spragu